MGVSEERRSSSLRQGEREARREERREQQGNASSRFHSCLLHGKSPKAAASPSLTRCKQPGKEGRNEYGPSLAACACPTNGSCECAENLPPLGNLAAGAPLPCSQLPALAHTVTNPLPNPPKISLLTFRTAFPAFPPPLPAHPRKKTRWSHVAPTDRLETISLGEGSCGGQGQRAPSAMVPKLSEHTALGPLHLCTLDESTRVRTRSCSIDTDIRLPGTLALAPEAWPQNGARRPSLASRHWPPQPQPQPGKRWMTHSREGEQTPKVPDKPGRRRRRHPDPDTPACC